MKYTAMTIFDLLFVLLFLTSAVTLIIAGIALLRGNRRRGSNTLRIWGISFGVYIGIVFAVALAAPQRVIRLGQTHCFDDWCIAVEHAGYDGDVHTVTFRLSSRAKRVSQREKGVNVYLTDAEGRRFDPAPDPSAIPMDVLLEPGQAIETKRSFTLPSTVRDVGVVVSHEGSYCFPGCFIIGDEGNPLHKRTIVPIQ